MKLLDTHIMLAVLGQVDLSLPENILYELSSPQDSFVSVVSIWEVAIKYRIGKLKISIPLNLLPIVIADQNIGILPITTEHALSSIQPEIITKDPFDRLLLGICAAEGMKLLTMDHAMVDHPLAWR
jgi:PIN domain nuclease of toxin-antitoxin system